MRPIIIGTGFLGKTLVRYFVQAGLAPLHTFNSKPCFTDSMQFDCFNNSLLWQTEQLKDVDTIIITLKIEDAPDSQKVLKAMQQLFIAGNNKRIIYLSTDAVFDGCQGMYRETDIPDPVTDYGRNKKLCEDLLRQEVSDHCIVRTSYIYGYSLGQLDSRLTNARASLRSGLSVHKFVDMYKSPVEVNQLAEIILKVSQSQFRGTIHACGARLSIHEFFRQSLNAMGENTDHLLPVHVPVPAPADYLRDTSLDSSCLRDTFGIEALPLHRAFDNQDGHCHH